MKRIAFIIPSLNRGGAERVVSILSNYLVNSHFQVNIYLLNYSESAYAIDPRVKLIPLYRGTRKNNMFSRVINSVVSFVRLFFNMVQFYPITAIGFTTTANLWTGLICNLLKIRYILSERTTPDRTINKLSIFSQLLHAFVYKRSLAIVSPSQGIIDKLKSNPRFRNLNNFLVIQNPVELLPDLSSVKVHSSKFILAVGRLEKVKGFDLLIESFCKVKDKEVNLLIVGEGRERDTLTQLIHNLNLGGRVFLIGAKDNIFDYYNQCELFVLSSRNEGYPNSLIEAMSVGCASIAFDCEFGPSEIIENRVNGLLAVNGDLDDMASLINLLLSDPLLKAQFREKAKLITETNSVNKIIGEWGRLILP